MSEDVNGKPPKKPEDSQEDGQVIRFPLERLKAQRRAKRLAGKLENQKRTTLFLSIVSLVALMAYVNQGQRSELQNFVQREGMERMVANSQLSEEEQKLRNEELATNLEQSSKRTPASYGRRPSAMEKLQYEVLKGRYRFESPEGQVVSIVLDESGGVNQKPVSSIESKSFLINYRDHIAPGYATVEFVESTQNNEFKVEAYDLFRSDKSKAGRAELVYDRAGGFRQLTVFEERKPVQE